MKITNLLEQDFKLVEKRKMFMLISAGIIAVGIIMMIIFGCLGKNIFNLGMDFAGGYNLNVKSSALTEETYNEYAKNITDIVENLKDDKGKNYGLKISNMQRQGEGDQTSILIGYKAVASEEEMNEVVNPKLKKELEEKLFIDGKYSGSVDQASMVGSTVATELLTTAILSILVATVLMLIYVAFRFELASGIAAIFALCHDVLIMCAFMAIFRVPLNSTFVAALITIVGYSINNTIIIFDRIREIHKNPSNTTMSNTQVANRAVRDTLLRTINTSLTTLITIGMVAIIGVSDIRIFALPIIVGLLAGTYSSVFIAPGVWAFLKDRMRPLKKREKKPKQPKVAKNKTELEAK